MEIGDEEGLGKVYTDKGNLILRPEERILVKEERVAPIVRTTWGYFGGEEVTEASDGVIFLTDQRFVFLAVAQTVGTIGFAPPPGPSAGMMAPPGAAGQAQKQEKLEMGNGVREYIEIPIKEILGCEIKTGFTAQGEHVNVYILSSGEPYHLTLIAKTDSPLLKRFKQKQVPDVVELMQNIKAYYKNTDWIYLVEQKAKAEYR